MAQMTDPRNRLLPLVAACTLALAIGTVAAQAMPAQEPLDQQAREAAWAGRTREALQLMDQHLVAHPHDRQARLERARYLSWNGDAAAAIEALDALGADDDAARALRARILAGAGRREAALALNGPLFAASPQDYELAWTQALASHLGEWPHAALPALATVQQLRPESKDTRDLAKVVRLPLFSWVGLPASVYEDSDDIEIRDLGLEANLRVSDRLRLLAGASRREHSAPPTSPFAPVTGGDSVDERRVGVGAHLAVSPDSAWELWLGRSALDPGDSETIGHLVWSHRASDTFEYRVRIERDRIAASPRSVSLGVMRNGIGLATEWRPTLRDTVRGNVGFDDFNDDNRRRWLQADYRHALYRGPGANVDIGGQVEWMGYSRDSGNGYYSSDRYVRVAPLLSTYLKLGEDAGLHLQAVVGAQRDDTFDNWKRATDLSAELTLGIFSHWQLVAQAAHSERLNEFGQYDGNRVGLFLRYRFCEHRDDRCPQPGDR
jgi:hypothetical protein